MGLIAIPECNCNIRTQHIKVGPVTVSVEVLHAHPARVCAKVMQVERVIRPVGGSCCIGAVLSGGAHIVGPFEACVDGRFSARARVVGVLDEALAGVVLFVGETCGGDCRAGCCGGGVSAGGRTDG